MVFPISNESNWIVTGVDYKKKEKLNVVIKKSSPLKKTAINRSYLSLNLYRSIIFKSQLKLK